MQRVKEVIPEDAKQFNLVGYSFGSLITLETARLLEESGMTGNVLLLDGSPKFLSQLTEKSMPANFDDKFLENAVLTILIKSFMPEKLEENMRVLVQLDTYEEKLSKLLELMEGQQHSYSNKYLSKMATLFYGRLILILNLDLAN